MKHERLFWVVMALAFALRACLLVVTGSDPRFALTPDSPSYIQPAQNLIHHAAFAASVNNQLVPEVYRTPGYPLFLTAFLDLDNQLNTRMVQWAQALLGTFTAGIVYAATLAFWKRRVAATGAGLLMALDFPNAIHVTFILTDVLFVFVMALLLLALVHKRYALTGLLVAIATFIRPVAIYYAGFLGALLVLYRLCDSPTVTWKRIGLFLALAIIPLQLWDARNYIRTGHWTFSTIQSANLYQVRAALVKMEEDHIPYEKALSELTQSVPEGEAIHYLEHHWRGYLRVMMKDAFKFLSGNSMKVAAWTIMKDERYNPETIPSHSTLSPREQARELMEHHPVLGVSLIGYMGILLASYTLSLMGIGRAWKRAGWRHTILLSSSLVYFSLLTLGVDAQARYRLPIMPALFLMAGGGAVLFAKKKTAP